MSTISPDTLRSDFQNLGIRRGDTILIRASLGAVGRLDGGKKMFLDALEETVGPEGTIVSLAFTEGSYIRKPKKEQAFNSHKKSYAGALPNALVGRQGSYRSKHPLCSYVAIGKHAIEITRDHNETSGSYDPIRKIIELGGKCVLIGCVKSSPGFTTTHLAEEDLGLLDCLPVFPWLTRTYYEADNGELKLFRRNRPGLCSNSYYKFYALYVREGILNTGYVGQAYSLLAPAQKCYEIDIDALRKNPKFNICGSPECGTCNAGRWDRIHHAPLYLARKIVKKIATKL